MATDVENYFEAILKLFKSEETIKIINILSLDVRPKNIISTRYEKKALNKGMTPLYLEVKKILD